MAINFVFIRILLHAFEEYFSNARLRTQLHFGSALSRMTAKTA
jgi:hypothetical protein